MVKIVSATFGDDFGSTDVTESLGRSVKDGGIDVHVDSSLIPIVDRVSGAKSVRLEGDEQREIKDAVADMCGPTDQVCQEVKTQDLVEAKLKQKEAAKTKSTAEIIKGRKLKVTYIDEYNKRHEVVIPEGQQFQADKLGKIPEKHPPIETVDPVWKQVLSSWWSVFGLTLLAFLYASSIILTWMTFVRYGSKLFAAGMVAIAVFIPYSGFGLVVFGPLIAEFFRVEKLARMQAVVPEEFVTTPLANLSKLGKGIIPTAADPLVRDPPRK